MPISKQDKEEIRSAVLAGVEATRDKLDQEAARLRAAILKCAPKPLLCFLWRQMSILHTAGTTDEAMIDIEACDITTAMEYQHAVLASHPSHAWGTDICTDSLHAVLRTAARVRSVSLAYSHLVNRANRSMQFSHHAGELHFMALSNWIMMRAYRYGVLESEFLRFALMPHSDALKKAYGVDAGTIADGLQAATAALMQPRLAAHAPTSQTSRDAPGPTGAESNNVTCTSKLPTSLLDDLSYSPGENTEFFGSGPLCGTPLRTLPARLKPLIFLDDGHYACDPYFLRDSAYRAIQRGLRDRLPEYGSQWTQRQTEATEIGFAKIFNRQLEGANVLRSVYYREVETGNWCELDLLVTLDDVLFAIEVKGGVMATHSPELDFEKYSARVEQLIQDAYRQSARFLAYANSRTEVILYQRDAHNQKRPVGRLRLGDYRLVFPIGLTIESFVPFSAASKHLPGVEAILGRFPFIAMAIDDLFILNRFLPTAGELMHYLKVRQLLADNKALVLVDEVDHLGLYISYMRFDLLADLLRSHGSERIVSENASRRVDAYFNLDGWEYAPPPRHDFPRRLSQILAALDAERHNGFLRADAMIRDFSSTIAAKLEASVESELRALERVAHRRIAIAGKLPVLLCLQRAEHVDFTEEHREAAASLASALGEAICNMLIVHVREGKICGAWSTTVGALPALPMARRRLGP